MNYSPGLNDLKVAGGILNRPVAATGSVRQQMIEWRGYMRNNTQKHGGLPAGLFDLLHFA